jgi:hypothetical protein
MKERPILFSAPMVRAILEGRKTQTRRIAKELNEMPNLDGILKRFPNPKGCRYGKPGDRLWVRETWAHERDGTGCPDDNGVLYRATDPGWDDEETGLRWRPSIFMPRRASRITLEITDVRVQRLQEISEEDAQAEGAVGALDQSVGNNWCASQAFAALWESINGPDSWDANPWVWAVTFRNLGADQ